MLFFIVLVHELGHSYMAYRLRWRIKKITLLPFGGMAETEEYGNRPVREEFLVTINGPLQHVWLIGASYLLIKTPYWTQTDHDIFLFHNLTILIFNLLPILPLDGGRLMFAAHSYFFSFHKAYHITYYSSGFLLMVLTTLALSVFPFHLNLIVVIMFLWLHHYLEWKQRHFIFLRFLLERNRERPRGKEKRIQVSPSTSVQESVKLLNRQRYHYFAIGRGVQLEEEKLLDAFFDGEKRMLPIGKLI